MLTFDVTALFANATLNYKAILLATCIDYVLSSFYFRIFYNAWTQGMGKVYNVKKDMSYAYFASLLGCFFVQYGIARISLHFPGIHPVGAAAFVWVCFMASTLGTDMAWGQFPFSYWVVMEGHWLMSSMIGAVTLMLAKHI
mmetsp:Transcript_10952/g.17917  ORF Transcript_10952/g.17917 Transcript_10952/m.17917 type:complete len:141 (-) Transcript_10952:52-474(-)